jgi:GNAT superfamily N-acetyltransferase
MTFRSCKGKHKPLLKHLQLSTEILILTLQKIEYWTIIKRIKILHRIFYTEWWSCGLSQVKTGEAQTEPQDYNALEIHRIYVLQTYHGKNIGQQLPILLYKWGIINGASYIWLGVWVMISANKTIMQLKLK